MSYLHRLAPVGAVALAAAALPLHAAATADDPIEDQMASALSEGGAAFAAGVDWDRRPEYGLWARIEPDTGEVAALMSARLPVGAAAASVTLRWLPGDTMREWTVAHEVGHMWWHALVGNDSITSPVVDEALAQHSACLVERELRPADADAICDVNTSGQFDQLSLLMGVADGPADQATDDFATSTQYGALVYGKAPLFYRELEERYGVEATTTALAAVVEEHAFDQITSDQLRTTLGEALGDPAGVDELWQRWIEEAHAAEDLPR